MGFYGDLIGFYCDLIGLYGDLIRLYGDLMGFYGGLMGLYGDLLGYEWDIPSGYVKIAIEHDHRNNGFSHKRHGGSFHNYVKLQDGSEVFLGL